MADFVTRIWAGPFEAHATDPHTGQMLTVRNGDELQVTARQAEENPGWFAPLPTSTPTAKPVAVTVPTPDLAEAA